MNIIEGAPDRRLCCQKCGCVFRDNYNFGRHQRRKTPCAPILEKDDLPPQVRDDPELDQKKCVFCGRVLSSYTAMRRHVRETCRIAPNKRNGEAGMEILYEHTLKKQVAQQVAQLEAQGVENAEKLDRLEGMMQRLLGDGDALAVPRAVSPPAGPGMVNQAVSLGGVVNQGVVINVFGQESTAHITREQVREMLDAALAASGGVMETAARAAIEHAARMVFSDLGRPGNITCFLGSRRRKEALVHGASGWEVRGSGAVMGAMTTAATGVLFDHQPLEGAENYGKLMGTLRDREDEFTQKAALEGVLEENRTKLTRLLGSLPRPGSRSGGPATPSG